MIFNNREKSKVREMAKPWQYKMFDIHLDVGYNSEGIIF